MHSCCLYRQTTVVLSCKKKSRYFSLVYSTQISDLRLTQHNETVEIIYWIQYGIKSKTEKQFSRTSTCTENTWK